MTKPKIAHPYHVPDGFFDLQEKELMIKLDGINLQETKKSAALQVLKYAAIIVAAIFLGRESVLIFPPKHKTYVNQEFLTVDLVLSQVSDEDISEFFIENIAQQGLTEK
jgi:hypothetical protein